MLCQISDRVTRVSNWNYAVSSKPGVGRESTARFASALPEAKCAVIGSKRPV
jgi:hypothetical protein